MAQARHTQALYDIGGVIVRSVVDDQQLQVCYRPYSREELPEVRCFVINGKGDEDLPWTAGTPEWPLNLQRTGLLKSGLPMPFAAHLALRMT